MRVYVETNFVIELVLEQEEHDACEALLRLAERGAVQLALPALCLFEADHALQARMKQWKGPPFEEFRRLLREASRMRQVAAQASQAQQLLVEMQAAATVAADRRLREVRQRLLASATLLPLDREVLGHPEFLDDAFGLKTADALVLSSVLRDLALGGGPSFFLNKNTKDFGDQAIKERLQAARCEFRGKFSDGLNSVRAALGRAQ